MRPDVLGDRDRRLAFGGLDLAREIRDHAWCLAAFVGHRGQVTLSFTSAPDLFFDLLVGHPRLEADVVLAGIGRGRRGRSLRAAAATLIEAGDEARHRIGAWPG